MMIERQITYREAIKAALAAEMRNDDKVILLGEDIAQAGGVFKITEGLLEEFGERRVKDTPISETAFVGAALGLAITGYRPVVEIMFADFMGVCFDQIVNSIAKHKFMSGGKMSVPLVIRVVGGAGLRFGPQHSQTCESWLLQFPGLRVMSPSSPSDAYGMLRSAIRSNDPVVFIEHKALLGLTGDTAFDEDHLADISTPSVIRDGNDITIVANSAMTQTALKAHELMATENISSEIIDLRVLNPINSDLIVKSVMKTGRLLTVEEQHANGGWGAEVVARVSRESFFYLDAPPIRLTLPNFPVPYSPGLEDAVLPSPKEIANTARELISGNHMQQFQGHQQSVS